MRYFNLQHSKKEFKLPDFLFWAILAVIFPAVTGNFSLFNILHVFMYLGAVHLAGEQFLKGIDVIHEMPSLIKTGIYIVIGSVICGIIFVAVPTTIFLYLLFFLFLFDLLKNKKTVFTFSFYHFLCIAPFFIILFQTYELEYAIHTRYGHLDGDYWYYTAIVESLKTNQSLTNAVFHVGLPINYSSLPFMAPAQLARFSGISSQFALWGVFMKIVPVVCLSTIAYVIVKLYEILFGVVSITSKIFNRRLFITGLLFLFLGPIHFINLQRLDIKHALFLGLGYLLPTGSPGYAMTMLLAGILLLLIISKTSYNLYYKIVIILLLCFAVASKIALFIPLAIFLGCFSLLRIKNKQKDLFITLLFASVFCLLIYTFTVGSPDSVMAPRITSHGFFFKTFGELATKYNISGSGTGQLLMMTGIIIFMWISIKLAIFLATFIIFFNKNFNATALIISALVTFCICLLPGFFIENYGRDNTGKILFDGNFDMGQFVRGSIFLITIVSLIFVLFFLFSYRSIPVRRTSAMVLSVWCAIIAVSFLSNELVKAGPSKQPWYVEVQKDFIISRPQLMTIMGNFDYSGQAASAIGVHPWYCTGRREEGEGYVFAKTAYERYYAFKSIFDTNTDISKRRTTADSFRQIGVDCIVGSPSTIHMIDEAVKDSIISPIPGTIWMFKFNSFISKR